MGTSLAAKGIASSNCLHRVLSRFGRHLPNNTSALTPLQTLDNKASIGRALKSVLRDSLIVRAAIPG